MDIFALYKNTPNGKDYFTGFTFTSLGLIIHTQHSMIWNPSFTYDEIKALKIILPDLKLWELEKSEL